MHLGWIQSQIEPINFLAGKIITYDGCISAAAAAAAAAKSLQSCPTLYDPIVSSPPGSSVPGILQERTLECVAISFSNAQKWNVKVKSLSCVQLLVTPWTAACQTPLYMGFSRQEYWSTSQRISYLSDLAIIFCSPASISLMKSFHWPGGL